MGKLMAVDKIEIYLVSSCCPLVWERCGNYQTLLVLVDLSVNFVINSFLYFLFRFLRNETVLFSVQGWTIYIVGVVSNQS